MTQLALPATHCRCGEPVESDHYCIPRARAHPLRWAQYVTRGEFQVAAHHQYIADRLLDVVAGTHPRVCICCPPQYGKTYLTGHMFTSWLLGKYPTWRILQVSYSQDLARESTTAARDLLAEHGPEVFGVEVNTRAKATSWQVYQHGKRMRGGVRGVGVGGSVTGRAFEIGVLDDLFKGPQDAGSPAIRNGVWEFMKACVLTRCRRIIMPNTRWHEDDHVGRLKDQQAKGKLGTPWEFVTIPCVAEGDDALGRRPGEPLWLGNPQGAAGDPTWFERTRKDVGEQVWSALYQGSPTPPDGAMFKRAWWRRYQGSPLDVAREKRLATIATVDLATSKRDAADFFVCSTWGVSEGWQECYLLDVFRRRVEGPEINARLSEQRVAWRHRRQFLLRAGHNSVIQSARQAKLPVQEFTEVGDKVARAMTATAEIETGRMLFPEPDAVTWWQEFEAEMLRFPKGEHDDQVDTVSAMAALLVEHRRRIDEGPRDAQPVKQEYTRTATRPVTGPHGRTW